MTCIGRAYRVIFVAFVLVLVSIRNSSLRPLWGRPADGSVNLVLLNNIVSTGTRRIMEKVTYLSACDSRLQLGIGSCQGQWI